MAVRAYGALLRLLPSDFRAAHGRLTAARVWLRSARLWRLAFDVRHGLRALAGAPAPASRRTRIQSSA
jgi:hypothetical protein